MKTSKRFQYDLELLVLLTLLIGVGIQLGLGRVQIVLHKLDFLRTGLDAAEVQGMVSRGKGAHHRGHVRRQDGVGLFRREQTPEAQAVEDELASLHGDGKAFCLAEIKGAVLDQEGAAKVAGRRRDGDEEGAEVDDHVSSPLAAEPEALQSVLRDALTGGIGRSAGRRGVLGTGDESEKQGKVKRGKAHGVSSCRLQT